VPTAAGGASWTLWTSRWPWPRRGGAGGATAVGAIAAAGGTSDQPDARRACLLCAAGFLFESRAGLGAGATKVTSSLSDGSESSVVGLRGPSAWLVALFVFVFEGVGYSASSAKRIQPSLPFWKSCLTVALFSPVCRFFAGAVGLPFACVLETECARAEWQNAIYQRSRVCVSAVSSDGRRT
jgi:hypothetical protein